MKKKFLLLVIATITVSFSYGQGIVRGKVTDEKGETIIGAAVVQKNNHSVWSITDLDGNYSLKITDSLEQTIVVSFVSYKNIEEVVHPVKGEVIVRNFVLVSSSAREIKEVTVTAKAVRAKEYFTEILKKNSAITLDYISSETMKKTGDVNVVAAVARVPGVSTNGGFITVRGIGDRYVKTSINGSRIPTLDPFTNNIKLDLFPASLVDNVLITKTASPDLPGDWAGAYLSVETKDYPENLSVNVETSLGYNNQTSFKDVITSQRSSTDWLGYDNHFRDHSHNDFISAVITPTKYQEFVALGLGDYYNSLGVTQQNWTADGVNGDDYYKLGLVQLGLLAPALINDADAVTDAKNQYVNGPYRAQAFSVINTNAPATGKSFPANWNTTTRKAPLNFSQSFSIGNQTKLFGKPLGFLLGYRYGSSMQYDPDATASRASVVGDSSGNYIRSISSKFTEESSMETNGWSALLNLAYKLNSNNSISFLFMPNLTGTNKVRKSYDNGDPQIIVATVSQFYEQRKQLVYQFKSEHYLPASKIKIEANASYTNGKSSAPDFKNLQYWKKDDGTFQIGGTIGNGIHRYYRYLSDNLFDSRLSAEFPIGNKPGLTRKIKFGGAYQENNKESNQYDYSVGFGSRMPPLTNEDIDAYLNLNEFDVNSGVDIYGVPYSTLNAYYAESNSPANRTFGNSTIAAAFAMVDYAITPLLRFSGGLRVEQADIFTDVFKYDSLGYPENDLRRDYSNGSQPLANPGKLNELSYLPSANLIYKLKNNEEAPINLRLNYSQTVARPSIRELSDVAIFDYEYRSFVFGNSKLKMVRIDNYDLRIESYFKSGDNASVSLFYKDFRDHIELVNSGGFSWQNVDKSNVKGIELEGKKKITKQLSFSANVTFVSSVTNFVRTRMELAGGIKNYIPVDTVSRTMFGQAPYIVNAILSYTSDSIGLTLTASYNIQGPRLVIASDNKEVPDIYELPRNLLDFKVTKSLGKHFSASITVRDILNTSVRRSYKYPEGYSLDYDKYTYGTNYVLGISYKL